MNLLTTSTAKRCFDKATICLLLPAALSLCCVAHAQSESVELSSPDEREFGDFGFSVSGIPDVNGDGKSDVAVGALYGGNDFEGRVHLFDGVTGNLLRTLHNNEGLRNNLFGFSVSGISDVDGDGRGDAIVGEPFGGASTQFGPGSVFVYSGASGALLRTLVSSATTAGSFGTSVAGIGDLNGNGSEDIVVGSRDGPDYCGRVYIYDGSSGAHLRSFKSPNEEANGGFGESVSPVPDVNGNGSPDVVAGAANEGPGSTPDGAGRVYIFDGTTGTLLQTLVSPNEEEEGHFGTAVSGIADVNGDGRGDVIVGAEETPESRPLKSGRAYIFDGSTGELLHTLLCPDAQSQGRFGGSVCGITDRNGDGAGDAIVGAGGDRDIDGVFVEQIGHAYIFDGSSGLLLEDLTSPNQGGRFGHSVSDLDDTNGDGLGEAIVGTHKDCSESRTIDAQKAYIFLSPEPSSVVAGWQLYE